MKFPRTTSANCLAVVLVILVIAGVGIYFISKPIQGRLAATYESITDWTPQRIGKDPAGYMLWASGQLDTLQQRCVGEGIRLNAKLAEIQHRISYTREALELQESDTKAFTVAYKEAEAGGGWPATFRNRAWQKNEMEDELLRLDSLAKSNREILPALAKAEAAIPLMLPQLEDRKREIAALKIRVQTARDVVDISALSSSYEAIRVETEKIANYTTAVQSAASSKLPGPDSTQVRIDQSRREASLKEILNK
ncbi:MAG: hypothetical protein D4R65_10115 [Verrucomicrobiaceae bacterium]|nr:MAG: hypothetical protein D4R65_10115 [Verrucomicrobiaceae bacterium]